MTIDEKIDKFLNEAKYPEDKYEFVVNPFLRGKKEEQANEILKKLKLKGKTFTGDQSDKIVKMILDNYGKKGMDYIHKQPVVI